MSGLRLQTRPGSGLRSELGLPRGGAENLKRHPEKRKVRDLRNGPSLYAEADGDKELDEIRHGGSPDEQNEERTLPIRRDTAV
ncbi:hypothetical protein NDU88_004867 [Pleurodeles waltl]|uniref:Uncharacterized protein n=1 Tax=Pleurodeles waltl TaxID=8319 RepID=A0AAV7V2C3_PLEWA|nr:hypothetical protein NDU88_004867 [Pleurodeles waltl]